MRHTERHQASIRSGLVGRSASEMRFGRMIPELMLQFLVLTKRKVDSTKDLLPLDAG